MWQSVKKQMKQFKAGDKNQCSSRQDQVNRVASKKWLKMKETGLELRLRTVIAANSRPPRVLLVCFDHVLLLQFFIWRLGFLPAVPTFHFLSFCWHSLPCQHQSLILSLTSWFNQIRALQDGTLTQSWNYKTGLDTTKGASTYFGSESGDTLTRNLESWNSCFQRIQQTLKAPLIIALRVPADQPQHIAGFRV